MSPVWGRIRSTLRGGQWPSPLPALRKFLPRLRRAFFTRRTSFDATLSALFAPIRVAPPPERSETARGSRPRRRRRGEATMSLGVTVRADLRTLRASVKRAALLAFELRRFRRHDEFPRLCAGLRNGSAAETKCASVINHGEGRRLATANEIRGERPLSRQGNSGQKETGGARGL